MRFKRLSRRRLFLILSIILILLIIYIDFDGSSSVIENVLFSEVNDTYCFQWESVNQEKNRFEKCLVSKDIISLIWSHDGTGLMKYIQWIVTRKLSNIRITRLNQNCEIIQQTTFDFNSKRDKFIQIYLVSLLSNFDSQSKCSIDIIRMMRIGRRKYNQIYFKRNSIKATVAYQYLDKFKLINISLDDNIKKANLIIKQFLNLFKTVQNSKSIIFNSEDIIHSDLFQTERILTNFVSLLGIETSTQKVKDIIQYDSHQFTKDATWWDQSQTIEDILSSIIEINPMNFIYENDFYHLHGNNSFASYLSHSRQCFNDGTFAQIPSETIRNRPSTDKPERCSSKPFDCAFSDIYSFNDREQIYKSYSKENYFNTNPIKCGFAIESIIDKVRKKYGRNNTCQTIVYTCISNCYDPLPTVQDTIPPDTCFVALLDTKTKNALPLTSNYPWDLIDLGESASLFRVPPKITESLKTVGHRMFPIAKWIVWLDGKAFIINVKEILSLARTPVIGLRHPEPTRTPKSEVDPTIDRIQQHQTLNTLTLNTSILEIKLLEAEYTRDGFYSRSDKLGLKLFDIAIVIYRTNHPCIFRHLCGWHNEINYYAYRGQLSVYYAAERLKITNYLGFILRKFYHTMAHAAICAP